MLRSDRETSIWWASPIECQSALYRRRREGDLPSPLLEQALRLLAALVEDVDVVKPTAELRERAGRLLSSHPLRAADALQLAAALVSCDDTPFDETFVALDQRLREAALREGFTISPA